MENEDMIGLKIDEALSSMGEAYYPDILLITGDFVNTGDPIEFNNAKEMLDDFKNYDALSRIENFIFVPGNHDFSWFSDKKEIDERNKVINYKNFLVSVSAKADKVPDEKMQKDLDENLIQFCVKEIEGSDKAVMLIGMNSVMIDSKARSGQGFFSTRQFQIVKKLIAYYKKHLNKELLILSAFHHHIIPVSAIERKTYKDGEKFSLTLDARKAIDFFLDNNVRFALHGHQHQPSVVTWKDEARYKDKYITIISGGSVSAPRENTGDISKNSFMLYSINDEQLSVTHFVSSDTNMEEFILDERIKCQFDLWEKGQNKTPCDIAVNGFAPEGLELQEYPVGNDISDLYYLYLNVIDCRKSCRAIDKFAIDYNSKNENKVTICGLHHLYGKYDILIKYRHKEASDIFKQKLIEYLKNNAFMLRQAKSYFMNVSFEKIYSGCRTSIPMIKNTEDYLNSTWNMATLQVETGKELPPTVFLEKLQEKVNEFNRENNTKIEDIIRNYVIGQDQYVLFELFISCYQFPMLTRFTNLIEEIATDYGVDKSTHIIYYYDEREI